METDFPEVFALDVVRKTQLINALLDSMGFPGETFETSEEFFDELDRRQAEYARNPGSAIPAEEVIANLLAKRRERQHA